MTVEIYLTDLSEEKRKRVEELYPENNYDTFPLFVLYEGED